MYILHITVCLLITKKTKKHQLHWQRELKLGKQENALDGRCTETNLVEGAIWKKSRITVLDF